MWNRMNNFYYNYLNYSKFFSPLEFHDKDSCIPIASHSSTRKHPGKLRALAATKSTNLIERT